MSQLIALLASFFALFLGTILGYYARQSIARKRAGTIEQTLEKKVQKAKEEAEALLTSAQEKSRQIVESAKRQTDERYDDLVRTEKLLLRNESVLDEKTSELERKENDFREQVEKLKQIKESLEGLRKEAIDKLEKVAGLTKEKAKAELLENLEKEYEREVLERIRKLELEGESRYEKRAKEILAGVIQRYALPQAQEITTTTFNFHCIRKNFFLILARDKNYTWRAIVN